jgi:16S rRNA (guanine966-N2)-methyltransferase
MLRITGGKFRGRSIESPPRSRNVRPTTALIRESVFSRLQQRIEGLRFLDLFAGSGIMGLEALSRGAAFVLSVEGDKRQCREIQDHLRAFGLAADQAKAVPVDVTLLLAKPCREEPFDVVFLDPPYGFAALPELPALCVSNGWIRPNGLIIVEHGLRDPDLPGFTRRNYGDSSISIQELFSTPD